MHINEFRKIMLVKKAAQAAQQIQIVQQMQSQLLDDSYLMGTSMNGEDFILRKHMFDEIRRNMDNFKKQPKS